MSARAVIFAYRLSVHHTHIEYLFDMLQNKTDDPAWSFVYDATFDALLGISRSADLQTQNARIDTWMHTTKALMRQHGA